MSKAWRKSKAGWAKVRADALADNQRLRGGRCQLAIKGTCTGVATCVHHVLGRGVTGDDPRYLMASCGPCNEKTGDPARVPDPPARRITRW